MLEVKVTLELSKNFEKLLQSLVGNSKAEIGDWEVGGRAIAIVEEPQAQAQKPQVQKPELQKTSGPVQTAENKTSVPTNSKSYTLDELSKAAIGLMDAGKQADLLNVLNNVFGVSALPDIPKDRYGEFALKIRELGADI